MRSTRLISLVAIHWAEGNKLVPPEQSGFRPSCLLLTGVLSVSQEVKSNMTANILTLAVDVDYQKAYDKVQYASFLVKLVRMEMPLSLLKLVAS